MALYSLNDQMDFDHVIEITEDGTVKEPGRTVYAPEVYVECADDDAGSITREAEEEMIRYVESQGWELLTGFTGQYGYRGPIMHVSEYVGGYLEDYIRSNPGLYVVVEPIGLYPNDREDDTPIGWVIAYRETEEGSK